MTNGDIEMYWHTLRVFTKKLRLLLEELESDSVWVRAEPVGLLSSLISEARNEKEEVYEIPAAGWRMGFKSTTNTLTALLKVSVPFGERFEKEMRRDAATPHARVLFAKDLLKLADDLLMEFDKVTAGPAPPL